MTKTLVFTGQGVHPEGDVFVYDSDADPPKEVRAGEFFEVSDEQYQVFAEDPSTHEYLSEVKEEYTGKNREQLEEMARNAGVEDPHDTFQYPTSDSLVAAIEHQNQQPEQPAAVEETPQPAPPAQPQAPVEPPTEGQ